MPRNGSGVASKPAGTTAVPNTQIESAKYNSTIDDIYALLNDALPIVAGGTGATSAASALVNLGADGKVVLASKSGNYTAVAADNNAVIRFSAAATLSLTAASTLAANWHVEVIANGGDVVIDPNGSETIDGRTTLTVRDGSSVLVICDGTNFRTNLLADQRVPRGHINGLTLSNNATDATNDIDIATGEAASDGTIPYLMVLGSALTKRLDAAWAVGTGNGGLDTGTIANAWYYVWLIRRSDTGVVDALYSLSATSPTMPTSYDQKRLIGAILRTGGAIKAFSQRDNYFVWASPAIDLTTTTPSLTATNVVLTVPPLSRVFARVSVLLVNDPAADTGVWVRETTQSDEAVNINTFDVYARDTSQISVNELDRYVDASGQIMYKSNDSSVTRFNIYTKGFGFPR